MAYALRYHARVRGDDLPRISAEAQRRIARSIETRLTSAPERYGVPLSGTLHGYRKLRVGDYRVVFQISRAEVWILAIVHRRDAYQRAERRLAKGCGRVPERPELPLGRTGCLRRSL